VNRVRNANLKYAGLIFAIIGALIMIGVGFFFAWGVRSVSWFDTSLFEMVFILGVLFFGPGILTYIFVEE
jgi:hypothetical protein